MLAGCATASIVRNSRLFGAILALSIIATEAAAAEPKLTFVVIVTRHGVRSPTWDAARLNQYSADPWPDWGVPPGYLTVHGRALMKLMGAYYRDLFTQRRLLGDRACEQARRAYFWADTDQRTVETGRALAESIFPGCAVSVHSAGEGKRDPLFDPIEAGLAKPDPGLALAAVAGRLGPNMDALLDAHRAAFDLLSQVLSGGGKPAKSIFDEPLAVDAGKSGVSMSGPLSLASTLSEDLLLEYTDGMTGTKFGWGRLSPAKLEQIMDLHAAYAELLRRTPSLAKVRGSNLLSRIVRSLEQAIGGQPVPGALGVPGNQILIISGHDTNLSNLSGMLGLSWLLPSYQPDDAPPGASLIFWLQRSPETGRYSVRLQFAAQTMDQMHEATPLTNDHPPAVANVFVPGCSGAAADYPCDWTSFLNTANAAIDTRFVEPRSRR
jgi:4-phytase / acid phosphatase